MLTNTTTLGIERAITDESRLIYRDGISVGDLIDTTNSWHWQQIQHACGYSKAEAYRRRVVAEGPVKR